MPIDRSFYLEAKWGSRVEAMDALAKRILQMIDGFSMLHPSFERWEWGDYQTICETEGTGGAFPLDEVRPRMADAIERNMGSDGEVSPDPDCGYCVFAQTQGGASGTSLVIGGTVGGRPTGGSDVTAFTNWIDAEIGLEPEPPLTAFAFWRAALLLIAETWEATWAHASPGDIRAIRPGGPFDCAWMSYVSPRFARLITPPPDVIVEHRPNGGLFCAATQDTFRTDDPPHVAAARRIAAALQPLKQLPYPIDDPYR